MQTLQKLCISHVSCPPPPLQMAALDETDKNIEMWKIKRVSALFVCAQSIPHSRMQRVHTLRRFDCVPGS